MKKDILNRSDIEKVILFFYDKVREDESINFFFSKVVKVDWEKHYVLMGDFWENVLFYTGDYQGSPIETHKRINALHKTDAVHFERWLEIFCSVVDHLYKGDNADKMKMHARLIAEIMMKKI